MESSDAPRLIREQPMVSNEAISYRRNGKLFSCEPCRKGKLKCDHSTPTCGRCARLGRAALCLYHPAPLTKGRQPSPTRQKSYASAHRYTPYSPNGGARSGMISPPLDSGQDDSALTSLSQAAVQSDQKSTPVDPPRRDAESGLQDQRISDQLNATPMFPSLLTQMSPMTSYPLSVPEVIPASEASHSNVTLESCSSYKDRKHGFLGPTAWTAIYAEHSESTGFEDLDGLALTDLSPVTAENLERGASVLALLRDMPWFRVFTKRWFDTFDGLIILQPVFRIWYDELWEEWGTLLQGGSKQQLLRFSDLVFRNTRQPMRVTGTTRAVDWSRAATGKNLRWEVVGSIISLVGIIASNLSDWEGLFDDMGEKFIERGDFVERMRKASEICACFCYECEVLNDSYIAFMYQDLILLGSIKSDVHFASWQRLGEVVDSVVALGLHRGNYVDSDTPLWLSEFRRKLFVMTYARDKALASFLGRPPRLSYRYCKLEMPMDITEEDLFLEGEELETVINNLDEHGWSTKPVLSRRSWTRVWFQECLIREEILEVSLGSQDDDLDDKIDKIRLKLSNAQAQFPAFMLQSPDDLMKSTLLARKNRVDRVLRQTNVLYVMCINLGLKLTEFLLQRAIVNRGKSDTRTLIPISRRLLQTVLLVQTRKEFFKDFRGDIVWILVSYGLASAGVLAIELLKQEQSKRYDSELLPKSETIQDLSVFIAALNDVQPEEGNYNICHQGRRALKSVLDQILTPTAPLIVNQTDTAIIDENLYFPTGNDADFLQWLDNIDWDKNFPVPTEGSQASR